MNNIQLPSELEHLLAFLPRSYIVGGYVRDQLLGIGSKDIDIEVYGTTYEQLSEYLSHFGKVNIVGKSFGVAKLTMDDETYDFCLARKETKIPEKEGHTSFSVDTSKDITEKEGASRRDLTINSLIYDPRKKVIKDYFGGYTDLQNGILKHTSDKFSEDPLRVLRVAQFAARFDFAVDPKTVELSRSISNSFQSLAKERVFEEFNKLLLKGNNILRGVHFLDNADWLKHFPELANLKDVPQDPHYHPEGDVLTHTCLGCQAIKQQPDWDTLSKNDKLVYMYAILCHDMAKPACTQVKYSKTLGRDAITSHGHEAMSVTPALSFLKSLNAPNELLKRVPPLVKNHMAHLQVSTDTHIRKLAVKMEPESIKGLSRIVEADHSSRPPLPAKMPEKMQKILLRAQQLNCANAKPQPLIGGKQIQAHSDIPPGKIYSYICEQAYNAQIKGKFKTQEEAEKWFLNNCKQIVSQFNSINSKEI